MKKSIFLTSLVAASVLFTACGSDGGGGDNNETETPTGTKPVFTSPDSYSVVAGGRKAVTLTTGEFTVLDGSVFKFKITDKTDSPSTRIDENSGVITYFAPEGNSPTSITVTATRVDGGAVSDPKTITFTPVDPAIVTVVKPFKTGADADSSTSGIARNFTKLEVDGLNVKGPDGLIWADHDDTINAKRSIRYSDALDYCKGLSFLGGGWRMPNKDELLNLVDYSQSPFSEALGNPPMITQNNNNDGFANHLINVWAKQEFGKNIYISENDASMNFTAAGATVPVRCVKGEEVSREHLIHSDLRSYTYDETTKLEWSPATDDAKTTAEAIEYCEGLASPHTPPHDDFRLPSINELRSVVENGTVSDYITQGNRFMISSTPYVDLNGSTTSGQFWRLTLREDGELRIGTNLTSGENATLKHRVSCVRDMD